MNIKLLVLMVAVVLSCITVEANVIEADEKIVQHLLDTSDVFYLEFYSPSCGHCRKFAPVWERLGKALFGAVPVARVNVQQHTALSNKYGVKFVPDVRIFEHKADTAVNRGELTPVQLAQVIMAKLSLLDVTVEGLAAFLGIDPDSPVDPEDAIPRVLLLHRDEDERVKAFTALQEQHKSRVIFGTLSYSHATADAVAQIVGEISTKAQILTAQNKKVLKVNAVDTARVEQLVSGLSNRTAIMMQNEEQVVVTRSRSYNMFNVVFFGSVLVAGYFVYKNYVKKQDPTSRRKKNDHLYV
jgi:thiol-disulfide isomerase/thioredoxin